MLVVVAAVSCALVMPAARPACRPLQRGPLMKLPENDGRAEDSFAEDTMVVACGLDREVPGLVVARQPLAHGERLSSLIFEAIRSEACGRRKHCEAPKPRSSFVLMDCVCRVMDLAAYDVTVCAV